jgi:hypothetical protein
MACNASRVAERGSGRIVRHGRRSTMRRRVGASRARRPITTSLHVSNSSVCLPHIMIQDVGRLQTDDRQTKSLAKNKKHYLAR